MKINIAIDGPAGAGKSTIAKMVAKKLNFIYVDTGALYRTVGLNCLRSDVDTKDPAGIEKILPSTDIKLKFIDNTQKVFLNGEDVSEAIRTPEASMAASNVSAVPAVRAFLFDLQKNIAENNDCIMDGRDIGTVVLPNAQVKIFMTASVETRAKRRYDELILKGTDVKYEDVLSEMVERDNNDSNRAIAPLKAADDAVIFDNGNYNLEESADRIIEIFKQKTECKNV